MKGLCLGLLFLASSTAVAAPHPAAGFVFQTLTKGKQILEIKDDGDRTAMMCAFLGQKLHTSYVADVWLGKYKNLSRDARAIREFKQMIPSILLTTAFGGGRGGGDLRGSFKVGQSATARGNGFFAVSVVITTAKNKRYSGKAIVHQSGRNYRVVDVEYLGFSGVKYQGREYQKILNEENRKDPRNSKPVTKLVNDIKGEAGYINCR